MHPAGRVEARPREAFQARNGRERWLAERAIAEYEYLGNEGAPGRREAPLLGVLVPRCVEQLGIPADMRGEVEASSAPAQVVQNLLLRREGVGPGRVGREGEGVEVGGHIASTAWVGVVAPGSTNFRGALKHYKVIDALLLEADRQPQPGESSANDGYADMFRVGGRPSADGGVLDDMDGHGNTPVIPVMAPSTLTQRWEQETEVILGSAEARQQPFLKCTT